MNDPQRAPQQRPPQKQGMPTWQVVLIIVGGLLFMGLSTCGVLAYRGYSEYREVATELAEGGGPLKSSPPEVVAELAGAKKDYVGSWKSPSGKSTLEIRPDGGVIFVAHEKAEQERIEGPIGAFHGKDMDVVALLHFTLKVKTLPHTVGDDLEMVVNDITFVRPWSL